METIKVKYFSDDMEELCYVAGKSDWIDLSAAEEVTLHAGDFQLIPLGVAIALPEGYALDADGMAYDEYGRPFAPVWPEEQYDPAAVWGESWLAENWGSNG